MPFAFSLWHLAGMMAGAMLGGIFPPISIYFMFCLWLHAGAWWFQSRQIVATSAGHDFLLGLTGLGPLLCLLARRKPTYYQLDAAAIFQTAVQQQVMEIVDALCETQNVRPLGELERKPVAREFLKK